MTALPYYKLSDKAQEPTRATMGSAGIDLRSAENKIIPAWGRATIRTGLQFVLPAGTYGRIAPRSGLAANYGIDVGAGVIDPDYTGEIIVVLFNHNNHPFQVEEGAKIAQLILEKFVACSPQEVKMQDDEEEQPERKQARMSCSGWLRGSNGFGSSGMK